MKNKIHSLLTLHQFLQDTRGGVALTFAFILLPLVLMVGVGADFGVAMNYKQQLQAAVDSAALAGASAYTPTSGSYLPTSIANSYMTKYAGTIPGGLSVSSQSSASTVSTGSNSGAVTGYTVKVSATVNVPNSFMTLSGIKTTAVTVSATAENPVLTALFDTGGFTSGACDDNAIYWYIVPPNGGVPDASAMNLLWDNGVASPPSATSFSVLGSQKIGFALKNSTYSRPVSAGGCSVCANGGCTGWANMYGSVTGDSQWFYSHMQPPTAAYNIAPGGSNTGTHGVYPVDQDCSLVVEKGITNNGQTTYPNPPQGTCFTASGSNENTNINDDPNNQSGFSYGTGSGETMAQAMGSAPAPSCSQLGGNSYQYDWNDMGGNPDSLNYGNDMIYTFSCAGTHSGGTSSGVYLVQ